MDLDEFQNDILVDVNLTMFTSFKVLSKNQHFNTPRGISSSPLNNLSPTPSRRPNLRRRTVDEAIRIRSRRQHRRSPIPSKHQRRIPTRRISRPLGTRSIHQIPARVRSKADPSILICGSSLPLEIRRVSAELVVCAEDEGEVGLKLISKSG